MRSAIVAVILGVMEREEFEKNQPLATRKALAIFQECRSGAPQQDLSAKE